MLCLVQITHLVKYINIVNFGGEKLARIQTNIGLMKNINKLFDYCDFN